MRLLVKLRVDLVTGIARAPARLFALVFRERIAALDHESLDDAMESGPVIESRLRQLLEILDRLRGHVRPELGHHFSFAGLDHVNFFWFSHDGGLFLLFLFLVAPGRRGDERQAEHAAEQYQFHALTLLSKATPSTAHFIRLPSRSLARRLVISHDIPAASSRANCFAAANESHSRSPARREWSS